MPPTSHSIPNNHLQRTARIESEEVIAQRMTTYINKHTEYYTNIARGDTVILESEAGYRNNGIYMWNGNIVISLYTACDDYGSVPPEIEIADDNDFTADSWNNLVDHNNIVWFSTEIRNRIKYTLSSSLEAHITIRNTPWIFYSVNETVETVKNALVENRAVFYNENNHRVEIFVGELVHGIIRTDQFEEHAARIETELEDARANVQELERQYLQLRKKND